MSSLQVGLAVAGGLILGGVIAYNTWNARRNEPRQAQPESQPAPLVAERVEPTIDGSSGAPAPERVEPAFDTPSALQPLGPLPVPDKRPRLDALIDVIAPIALDGRVVSGDALLAALPATRRVGSKPFAVEAQNEDSGEWEHPVAGQRYTALQAGVQLANRTGALNDIEYSEFVKKAQRYADAVGGAPDYTGGVSDGTQVFSPVGGGYDPASLDAPGMSAAYPSRSTAARRRAEQQPEVSIMKKKTADFILKYAPFITAGASAAYVLLALLIKIILR